MLSKISAELPIYFHPEDKIRIVVEGLRGEDSDKGGWQAAAKVLRRACITLVEGVLEAGKRRLAGDTARAAQAAKFRTVAP